jgi:N-acylneuraminate cytidylyltransferase
MSNYSNCLFVIPARGGSKGIPGKNIKPLSGKPLIQYSIEYARNFVPDDQICLSTDSIEIIKIAENLALKVPFVRPEYLGGDNTSTFDVLKHTIDFFEKKNKNYDYLVLLQPTSPIRAKKHFEEAYNFIDEKTEVVVSFNEESQNPYYNVYEENDTGFLKISKGDGKYTRRQDCPPVYAINGSIYVFRIETLKHAETFHDFKTIKKYVMDDAYKVDLDTLAQWQYCEYLISNDILKPA